MNPHSYAYFIFDKASENIHVEKTASSTNVAEKWLSICGKTGTRFMFITLY
jgi:hypothetical protein